MPIADSKKVQHLIDVMAEEVRKLDAVKTRLQEVRTAFTTHNPSVSGTPVDGHVSDVSAWIDSVAAVAGNVVATTIAGNESSHHTTHSALGEDL